MLSLLQVLSKTYKPAGLAPAHLSNSSNTRDLCTSHYIDATRKLLNAYHVLGIVLGIEDTPVK